MQSPTQVIMTALSTLLGADAGTLAQALVVGLIKHAFVPTLAPVLLAADEADFDGYAPIAVGAATRPTAFDPATGDRMLDIPPPAGGYRWETTGATNLAQTIYGWYVGDDVIGTGVIFETGLFDAPIILNGIDQLVEVPQILIRMLAGGVQ
jgi:hypothetical protein